jgi:hypothetical protein
LSEWAEITREDGCSTQVTRTCSKGSSKYATSKHRLAAGAPQVLLLLLNDEIKTQAAEQSRRAGEGDGTEGGTRIIDCIEM